MSEFDWRSMALDAERRCSESQRNCAEWESIADELFALATVPRQFYNTSAYERYINTMNRYDKMKKSQ